MQYLPNNCSKSRKKYSKKDADKYENCIYAQNRESAWPAAAQDHRTQLTSKHKSHKRKDSDQLKEEETPSGHSHWVPGFKIIKEILK